MADFKVDAFTWNYSGDNTSNGDILDELIFKLSQLSEDDFVPQELSVSSKAVLSILYLTVITMALFGNAIVFMVIISNCKMQTVTNLFLLSLATSDVGIATLNMPMTLIFYLKTEWILGELLCKFCQYLQGVFIVASIFTLTAIGIDRYYAILHPLKVRHIHTRTRAILVIATIWITSILLISPQVSFQRVGTLLTLNLDDEVPIKMVKVCEEYYPSFSAKLVYTIATFGLAFCLPVLVMMVAYGAIANHLWKRQPIGEGPQRPSSQERRIVEMKSIMRMIFVIVFFFFLSWLPFFMSQLYFLFHNHSQITFEIFAILQLVGFTNTCVNPIVYCFLNDKFRHCAKALLKQRLTDSSVICGSQRMRRMSSMSTKVISSDNTSNDKH